MLGDGRTRITDFAFTPDGTAIVVSYCRISCYDMPSGVRWMISNGHEPVLALAQELQPPFAGRQVKNLTLHTYIT
jgi:hypothetical protein